MFCGIKERVAFFRPQLKGTFPGSGRIKLDGLTVKI
jgi:hypothetical protein